MIRAKPITMMGIITIARLMYACISILLVVAGFFVVIIACVIGYNLVGCHVFVADTECLVSVAYKIVRLTRTTIVAVCHAAIVWATVAGINYNVFSNHICSLVSMCVL
jgi:hypothetical protein